MESILPPRPAAFELSSSQTIKLVTTFTAIAILLPFMLHIYHDYLVFLALGPGGTPKTFSGYAKVKALSVFALRDPYSPAAIPKRFRNSPGYLDDLEPRKGLRPETRGIAPHRQISQKSDKEIFDRLASAFEVIAANNPNLVLGTSCFEKNGTGLFSVSPAKTTCGGEICHAHPSDGSLHLTLHPADARKVLEAGWAERHPIARGGWFERFVPGSFLMVYAPRDQAEVDVILRIVKASAWFVSGGDGVKDGVKDVADERRDSGYVSGDEPGS